jgi:hypothetical protein
MPYPISDLILQNVEDTLRTVRVVSGYNCNFIVERESQTGNSPRDQLAVVYPGDPDPLPAPALGHDEYHFPVGVRCYAIKSESSSTPIDRALLLMAADARKALRQDLHRGGYALNTLFNAKDELLLSESPKSVLVMVTIHYRTLWDDPYNQ